MSGRNTPVNLYLAEIAPSSPSPGIGTNVLVWLEIWFQNGYSHKGSQLSSAMKNMQSASEHPEMVGSYLAEELGSNRLVGAFSRKLILKAHISRIGVIPKAHSSTWHLIVDLSHPKHNSVNNGIPKNLCSLSCVTIEDAVHKIIEIGPGTELQKLI